MAVFFRSLRSSSSGNCLALWTPHSSILIDCGLGVQREFRELLEAHTREAGGLDAVLVSHAHRDHAAYGALRVLRHHAVPIYAHRQVLRDVREGQGVNDWDQAPRLRAFPAERFDVGDFSVAPFEVPHAPGFPTFGFLVAVHDGRSRRRLVVCTDFYDYAGVLPLFVDADFIFVEANHDRQLLREHPNPNSHYHLNNVKTASLLQHAVRRSERPPRAVMLGHLSEERNRRHLALGEIRKQFDRGGTQVAFDLDAAPAHRASATVEI